MSDKWITQGKKHKTLTQNLQKNNAARQVEGFCISYLAASFTESHTFLYCYSVCINNLVNRYINIEGDYQNWWMTFFILIICLDNAVLVLLTEETHSSAFFRSSPTNGHCNLDFNFKTTWVRVVWYFHAAGFIMKVKKTV